MHSLQNDKNHHLKKIITLKYRDPLLTISLYLSRVRYRGMAIKDTKLGEVKSRIAARITKIVLCRKAARQEGQKKSISS
jgi:hypothetical protein